MSSLYLNYICVSNDPTLIQTIEEHLGASTFESIASLEESVERLRTINADFPSALILDLQQNDRQSLSWISSIRNHHPLANIPIIAITPLQKKELSTKLGLYKNISEIHPHQLDHLSMYMEMLVDEHLIDRPPERAHPYSLEFFADLWREGLSASILLDNGRSFTIYRGGLEKVSDQEKITQALFSSPPLLQQKTSHKNGDWIRLGEVLWKQVLPYCESGFLRYRKWLHFIPTKDAFRALELPISLETRRLLFNTESTERLIDRIRSIGSTIPVIERDIEALFLLGLYYFDLRKNNANEEASVQYQNSDDSLEPAINWNEWLHIALDEELSKRFTVNPWDAFQFRYDQDLSLQFAQKRKQYRVFEELSSPIAKRKYQQLLDHLSSLEIKLSQSLHLYQLYGFPTDPEKEELYFTALTHMDAFRFGEAKHVLVQLNLSNPIYRANLAWASFLEDPSQAKLAFELLAPILRAKKVSLLFSFYAAILHTHLGQWSQAKKLSKKLLARKNSIQFRRILWCCQKREAYPLSFSLFGSATGN